MQKLKLLYPMSLNETEMLTGIDYIFIEGDKKRYMLPSFKTALLRQ